MVRGECPPRPRAAGLTEAVCYSQECVEVVWLLAIDGDPIGLDPAASIAAMDYQLALTWSVVECHRAHETTATGGAVAWPIVHVLGAQARRTMVAVASVGQRQDVDAAVLAGEALILGGSGDGCVSGLKGSSTRGAGFRVLFPKDPGLVGRGTDSPPFLLGRRLLPVPASSGLVASPNPDHDRGCGIVSATVKQETHFPPVGVIPAALAFGVVPCQPVTVAAQCFPSTLTSSRGLPVGIESPAAPGGNGFRRRFPAIGRREPSGSTMARREVDQPKARGWVKRGFVGARVPRWSTFRRHSRNRDPRRSR